MNFYVQKHAGVINQETRGLIAKGTGLLLRLLTESFIIRIAKLSTACM